jgi:hypothetical protein
MAIPKIIHYCWLSDDPVPPDYQKYRDLWKIKLPDYQFLLWDTKRFDINQTLWTRQAFESGMYACAADYIRFFAVYNFGGIYLDMDMEIIKPFCSLLDAELMIAYENQTGENLEAGCFGAVKGHEYIKKCMEYYNTHFFDPSEVEKIKSMAVSERHDYINPLIAPEAMKNAFEFFTDKKFRIYSKEYFTAKNTVTGVIEQTENTVTIHHFAAQYHSDEWRKDRKSEQEVSRILGETTVLSKIVRKMVTAKNRIKRGGIGSALQHYFNKYIRKKGGH